MPHLFSQKHNHPTKLFFSNNKFSIEKHSSFPEEVKEALKSVRDREQVTGKIGSQQFAWLVIHNYVFVWEASDVFRQACYRYELPPSSSPVLADYICVFKNDRQTSVVACTREGTARIWEWMEAPESYSDLTIRIPSSSSVSCVTSCEPYGVIIGTTASQATLHWLSMSSSSHHPSSRPFHPPSSWLGSLFGGSRRSGVVSICVRTDKKNRHLRNIYVLTETSLQKWESVRGQEKYIQEIPIQQQIKDDFRREEGTSVLVWLLDAQILSDSMIYVLAASTLEYCPPDLQPTLTYSLAHIPLSVGSPFALLCQTFIPYSPIYSEDHKIDLLKKIHLQVPRDPSSSISFISTPSCVFVHDTSVETDAAAPVQLGPILAEGPGLYASENYGGVVAFNFHSSSSVPSFGTENIQEQVDINMNDNPRDLFSSALKAYSGPDKRITRQYVDRFPENLTEIVTAMSCAILDAPPSSDPHWADDKINSGSVMLRQQIEVKRRKHSLLFDFLKDNSLGNLWNSLEPEVQNLVQENEDKVAGALLLRNYHNALPQANNNNNNNNNNMPSSSRKDNLIQQAIQDTLVFRKASVTSHDHSPHDLFYTELTKIDEILGPVYDILLKIAPTTAAHTSHESSKSSKLALLQANNIFQAIVTPMKDTTLSCVRFHFGQQMSIRTLLEKYLFLVAKFSLLDLGAKDNEIFDQFFSLTDCSLRAHSFEASLQPERAAAYADTRHRLIQPFLASTAHQDKGLLLAEKFKDYESLFEIYDMNSNNGKILHKHLNLFKDQGYPVFVFHKLHELHRYRELLSLPEDYSDQLSDFLVQYPSLASIHFLRCKQYKDAANAFVSDYEGEKESLDRQKTLLSLAKLSNLAYDCTQQIDERIEDNLYLIQSQAKLELNKPTSPENIVIGFLDKGNIPFALDTIRHSSSLLSEVERRRLLTTIWSSAVNMFPWNIAQEWKQGRIDDGQIEQAIANSEILINASDSNFTGLLPIEMLQEIAQSGGRILR
eukprot:TRINITY_DN7092_c0_g1_i1.p1 TRINITY_DN7092_c0_g1~~TRINITY_DN7092_c0_g1_i1.p1  ORF type:complete len:1000 (-),score=284.05 TRINITY_DN7092_c0_g1_i1:294-3293(-)